MEPLISFDQIHLNPLQEKWNLAKRPEVYYWSFANFYESGKDELDFYSSIWIVSVVDGRCATVHGEEKLII